jgi:TetR/AcrR family fatty acid metabolism transcriptional regulator
MISRASAGVAREQPRSSAMRRVFRNMFLGAFTHMALRWIFVKKEHPYDKMKEIDLLVDMLTAAVSNPTDPGKTIP